MIRAHIISIGTELTTGQQVDTNSAWLADSMTAMGVRVMEHITVDDQRRELAEAFNRAMDRADLVIATGGLGPTPDDLTRYALADALDQPLELNPEANAMLESFFERLGRAMPESNRVQAKLPRGSTPILNPCGTAPGIFCELESCTLFLLPGVPREMKEMFDATIRPWIVNRTGGTTAHRAMVHTFGMSEARIGEQIADMMARDRNPLVGTTAKRGHIGIRVIAHDQQGVDARSLLQADIEQIKQRLGQVAFGEDVDTLESVVGSLLRDTHQTMATAESCTGGLLAKRLTDVPGSSEYFLRGYVTYTNEAKSDDLGVDEALIKAHGAVSEAVAEAMALGCRTKSGADFALSTTGIAGPTGGSSEKPVGLVYVGLAGPKGVEVKELRLGDHLNRDELRDRTCSVALNHLRLRLINVQRE